MYAIVFLILDASFVIGSSGPFIQTIALAASAGARIIAVIDHPDTAINVYADDGVKADHQTFKDDIVLKDVSFAYPARPGEVVLDKVSFQLKAGTTIGIVGASGSGKSTVAALLLRLYDPAQGTVSVGDIEFRNFNLASLRSQISLVDQDPAIFSGTIFTNIRQGLGVRLAGLSEEEERDRCVHAAKEADAWSFIEALPDGMDTKLGEPAGTKLSGGQKQRLCLARALVGDPSLLILDEATSALDANSEASILGALAKVRAAGNRTIVMIAHRLATVKDADNIIVMGRARVIEKGSHAELMTRENGAYRGLVEAQQLEPAGGSSDAEKGDEDEKVVESTSAVVNGAPQIQTALDYNPATVRPMSAWTVIRRCFALSRSEWPFTALAVSASIVTGGLILGESLIFGNLVAILNITDDPSLVESKANFFCLMFFVLALIALAAYTISGTCFGIASEHLILRTRDLSLRTILRQDAEWFLQPGRSTAALTSVLSMDSGHLSGLTGVILGTVFSGAASVIGGAILAHIVAWRIAIVLFSTSPVLILAGYFRLHVIAKLEERNQREYTEAAAIATEAFSAIRTVAALGTERDVADRFRGSINRHRGQTMKDTVLGNLLLAFALAIT